MSETKRIFYRPPFFDPQEIEKKLTQMAAEGWMLEKLGYYFSTYRKIEPAELRFCVTYFPKASTFDSLPTFEEQQKIDYCAMNGWKLLTRLDSMQIYCTDQPDAVPLETDAVVQVKNMYRSIKKTSISAYFLAPITLMQLGMQYSNFKSDPLNYLSDYKSLALLFLWLVIPLILGVKIFTEHRWYKKAVRIAAQDGTLTPLGEKKFIYLLIILLIPLLIYAFNSAGRFSTILLLVILYPAIIIIEYNIKGKLKDIGASRTTNLAVTIISTVVLTCITIVIIIAHVVFTHTPSHGSDHAVSYTINGETYHIYDDPQPVKIKDILALGDTWDYTADHQETFLLSYTEYYQKSIPDSSYSIYYSIASIKIPALTPFIRSKALVERNTSFQESDNSFLPLDESTYGVEEIYQQYYDDLENQIYYIFNGTKIITIRFSDDYTGEQISQVLQALSATTHK